MNLWPIVGKVVAVDDDDSQADSLVDLPELCRRHALPLGKGESAPAMPQAPSSLRLG